MEATLFLDWIVRILNWILLVGVGWVMIALYASMRRKGNVRMAEMYWWFLTIQAVVIAILAGIKVYEGLETARILFAVASLASCALVWVRITRPAPTRYRDEDDSIEEV
jgi:purine-cytosine permease-like protein